MAGYILVSQKNTLFYHPLDEERFQKFQEGIGQLISKCKASGAKDTDSASVAVDVPVNLN